MFPLRSFGPAIPGHLYSILRSRHPRPWRPARFASRSRRTIWTSGAGFSVWINAGVCFEHKVRVSIARRRSSKCRLTHSTGTGLPTDHRPPTTDHRPPTTDHRPGYAPEWKPSPTCRECDRQGKQSTHPWCRDGPVAKNAWGSRADGKQCGVSWRLRTKPRGDRPVAKKTCESPAVGKQCGAN